MPSLGGPELVIILILVVLLFGSTRLPRLARSLGEARGELRRSLRDEPDASHG